MRTNCASGARSNTISYYKSTPILCQCLMSNRTKKTTNEKINIHIFITGGGGLSGMAS